MWKVTVKRTGWIKNPDGTITKSIGDPRIHWIPTDRLKFICEILESLGYEIFEITEVNNQTT